MKRPYGIAFYPPGPDPQWVYIGSENEVVRFPIKTAIMKARGHSEHLPILPTDGHWTRAVEFSSGWEEAVCGGRVASNVDDPDTTPRRKIAPTFWRSIRRLQEHASVCVRNPQRGRRDWPSNPQTGELWCSVNERDALGDNLVPDYITHVQEGGFYGWPWWYIGAHQDPRHRGEASGAER